jgi:hypothetical protein
MLHPVLGLRQVCALLGYSFAGTWELCCFFNEAAVLSQCPGQSIIYTSVAETLTLDQNNVHPGP